MAFGISSMIGEIEIRFNNGLLDSMSVTPIPSTFFFGVNYGDFGIPEAGSDRADLLEILYQIEESDDGFLDDNDEVVTPRVSGLGLGITYSNFEEYGFPNPCKRGSVDRWIKSRQASGLYVTGESDLVKDADTGRFDEKPMGGVIPVARTPNTDNYSLPLDFIEISSVFGNFVEITFPLPAEDDITLDDLDDRNELIAIRTWLESIRTSGDAVGTDTSEDASFTGRNYRVTFGDNSGMTGFTVVTIAAQENLDSHVIRYRMRFARSSGPAFTENAVRATFDETTVSIPTTAGIEKPFIGSDDTIVEAIEYHYPNGQVLRGVNGELVWRGVDAEGNSFEVPLDAFQSRRYADLPTVDSQKRIPDLFLLRTIHFGHTETANGLIRIDAPPDLLNYGGIDKIFSFHNVSATYNLELRDWDDNTFLILTPGQYARIQILRESSNNGELIIQQVNLRELRWSYGTPATPMNFGTTPFFDDDTAGQHYWVIPVRGVRDYQDQDSFEIPTNNATATVGTAVDWDSYDWGGANKDFKQGFTMKAAGKLRFDLVYDLEVTAGAEMPQSNGPVIFHQSGTGEPVEEEATIGAPQAVADGIRTYRIAQSFDVEEGDFIFPVHRIIDTNTSTRGDIDIVNHKLAVEFDPAIRIEYDA